MSTWQVEARYIRDTREYFSNISVWPEWQTEVDPDGWLQNFRSAADKQLATSLLDSFLIISTKQCHAMVRSAFHSLSASRGDIFSMSGEQYRGVWEDFRASTIVSFPARRRDPGGSGHLFVREFKTILPNPTGQLLESESAVNEIAARDTSSTIVFVDDFSGSGNQFLETWAEKFSNSQGLENSFASLAATGKIDRAYFIPAIATWRARQQIKRFAPIVEVRPAHVLPPRYSAYERSTSLVPPRKWPALDAMLTRYSAAAGYSEAARYGYEDCGLALSFEHKTPDNTLPIFNGGPNRPPTWRPLRAV